jgi:hypothetical protein
MSNGGHLTKDGLQQIVNLKASMNLGISDMIKAEFGKNIKPVKRPIINTTKITTPEPFWIAGFTSGEGNYDAMIRKYPNKIGFRVSLKFRISQHMRDQRLLILIKNFLGVGTIENQTKKACSNLVVSKFSGIHHKILPFFNQYPIVGIKYLNFID